MDTPDASTSALPSLAQQHATPETNKKSIPHFRTFVYPLENSAAIPNMSNRCSRNRYRYRNRYRGLGRITSFLFGPDSDPDSDAKFRIAENSCRLLQCNMYKYLVARKNGSVHTEERRKLMHITQNQSPIGQLWNSIQSWLFPMLEDAIGELDEKHQLFVAVCEMSAPQVHLEAYRWCGNGCPPHDRLSLCKAFIAKTVWNFTTTRALIDAIRQRPALRRLCGWESLGEVPSEATFSRAFKAFANDERPQQMHKVMIETHYGEKLAGHLSRDATAIRAREKAMPKPKLPPKPKPAKRGRPRKDEPPRPPPEPTRLQLQLDRDLEANMADLPMDCDWGCKKNSQGKKESWRGYKLQLDVVDGDIPISAILTSASLHDSQAAIPLAQMSATRVTNLYDLADAAYDAKEIRAMSERLGHVAIIDDNPGRGEKCEFSPAEAVRYRERSSVERVNSHLHDEHGGRNIRVRGSVKVAAHLAFGLLVIAAEQMLRMLT